MKRLALFLLAVLCASFALAAPPAGYNGGASPYAPYTTNTNTGAILTDTTYQTFGSGYLSFGTAASGTLNLSMSPTAVYLTSTTCMITGTGSIGGVPVAGTYAIAGTQNNSQPYFTNSNGLAVWNISGSSGSWPANAWLLTGLSSVGGTPSAGLSGGTVSSLSGLIFPAGNDFGGALGSGTATMASVGTTAIAGTYTITASLTNLQPSYTNSNGLTVWSSSVSSTPPAAGTFTNPPFPTAGSVSNLWTISASGTISPNTCTITGTGSIKGLPIAGTYALAGTQNNSQPYYTGTNGLAVWNISGSSGLAVLNVSGSAAWPANAWLLTGLASVGGTPNIGLSGGTGTLGGLVFTASNDFGGALGSGTAATPTTYACSGANISGGSGALAGQVFSTDNVSGTVTAVGSGTASVGTGQVSTGASVPCSNLVLISTGTGNLVSSSSAAGTWPLPANVPVTLPLSNINQLWITGGSANNPQYLFNK